MGWRFYLGLAGVIPTPTSSMGDPFSSELLLGFHIVFTLIVGYDYFKLDII